jgi:predicted RNA binding protein YcfA (HicA-like mRNA interferase family)
MDGVVHTVRQALRLLQRDGWRFHSQTGSHRQFVHPAKPGRVTVAGKESDVVAPKTWTSILRQAGLK